MSMADRAPTDMTMKSASKGQTRLVERSLHPGAAHTVTGGFQSALRATTLTPWPRTDADCQLERGSRSACQIAAAVMALSMRRPSYGAVVISRPSAAR